MFAALHSSSVCAVSSEVTMAPGCNIKKKKEEDRKQMKIWKTKLKIWNDLLHVPWRRRRAVENCPAHPRWSRNLQSASAEKQAVNCFSWRLDVQAVAGGRGTSDKNVIKIQQGFFFFLGLFQKQKKETKNQFYHFVKWGSWSYTKRYWWRRRRPGEKWRRQTWR